MGTIAPSEAALADGTITRCIACAQSRIDSRSSEWDVEDARRNFGATGRVCADIVGKDSTRQLLCQRILYKPIECDILCNRQLDLK